MMITRLGILLVVMTLASANAFARGGGAAGHSGGGLPPLILPSAPAPASQALTGPSGPPPSSITTRSPAAAAGNLYPDQFNSFRH